jgi:hypothetical protein
VTTILIALSISASTWLASEITQMADWKRRIAFGEQRLQSIEGNNLRIFEELQKQSAAIARIEGRLHMINRDQLRKRDPLE